MELETSVPENNLEGLDSSLDSSPAPSTPTRPPNNRRHLLLIVGGGVLVVVLIAGVTISLIRSRKPTTNIVINTQSLAAGTLNQLEGKNQKLNEQLTITPNTMFKNDVAVQGNLNVDGVTHLQSAISLSNSLTVSSNLTVGGATNVGGNLTVGGLITASRLSVGSLNITNLVTSGDLNFGGHLVNTGLTPSAAAGPNDGGGSVSITGNDTSGTLTINTGGNPQPGEIAIVNFKSAFKLAPHVQLTPLNASAATSQYYVSPSATSFTVNIAANPKASTAYTFDYFVSQ